MADEITLTHYYDIPLHCPFCGKANLEEGEVAGCGHVMLMTCSEGIITAHPRLRVKVKEAGYDLTDVDDLVIRIFKPGSEEEDDIEFEENDVLRLAQSFGDSVTFCQVVGPPSGEESYTVFAYSDEEHEKYGEIR